LIDSDNKHLVDSLRTLLFAITILIVFSISRIGYSFDLTFEGIKCFSYLAFLLLLPSFIRKLPFSKNRISSLASEPTALITLLLLHLILLPFKDFVLSSFFYLIGILLLLWSFTQVNRSRFKGFEFFTSIIIVSAGLVLAFFLFASPYHNSLLLERVPVQRFINSGSGVIDVYYHSAIVSMISVYGTISTGLSGTPNHAYHSGSHLLFSSFCKALNLDSLSFYQIGYPIIVIPILLKSILVFTRYYHPDLTPGSKDPYKLISYLVLAVGLTYILPEQLGLPLGLWYSAYNSESHSLGLAYFFLLFASLKSVFREQKSALETLASLTPLLILVPLLIFTKTSTGAIAVLLFVYGFLRFGGYRNPGISSAFILSLIGAFVAYKPIADYVATYEGAFTFIFMGFYKKWFVFPWLVVHFLVIYFWSISVIFLEIKNNQIHSLATFVLALKNKKLIFSEVLTMLIIVGTIPGIMNIAGSNAMYFLEMQYFLGFTILALLLPSCNIQLKKNQLVLFTINGILIFLLFLNVTFSFSSLLKEQRTVRSALRYFQNSKRPWERQTVINAQNYIHQLRKIAKTPFSSRKQSAIFISPNSRNYWDLFDSWQFLPNTIGFFGPGISGTSFIYGLPQGKVRMDLYGLRDYDFSWVRNGRFPESNEGKKFAKEQGYKKLYVWSGKDFALEKLTNDK